MKKALKILGITLAVIIILLIALPYVFQSQIKDMIKRTINDNLNAKVEFNDVGLSFIKDFPKASISINDLLITNFEPFKNETFLSVKDIAFTVSIPSLFKSEAIIINSIFIDEALVTLKTNKLGYANYDIAKASEEEEEDTTSTETENEGFSLHLETYKISNSAITYIDEATNTEVYISELNHEGNGVFSGDNLDLNTNTQTNISVAMDSTKYLDNNTFKLDAVLGLDLKNSVYTFKENKALINKLALEFDGYVKLLDDGQEIDITFENPGSTFKDFLAVMPKAYTKDLDNITTTGGFKIKGMAKGVVSEETIPQLDINIVSQNASFKYPDLPKSVEQIYIDTSIKNTTGNLDDTYVNIKQLDFKIDEDVFKSSTTLKNVTENMLVDAHIDGTLNLGNLTKAYPVELETALSGILKAQINTNFDMNAIETDAYERIKNNGAISISDFVFSSEDLVNPIHISKADITFKPEVIALNQFDAKTGESDFSATGSIKNILGFLLSDNTLQGNFDLKSNQFKVSDFMTETETENTVISNNTEETTTEALKIPAFLDCTIKANAKTVVYDNLNLKNVTGTLIIKDQKATLQNMSSNIFNGTLAIAGDVSTKEKTPTYSFNLGASNFDIAQSFSTMELLQKLAPIAGLFQGKLNSSIKLSGTLDDEFMPELGTISGSSLANLLTTQINSDNSSLLTALESKLSFIDFNKINLKDVKTHLEFADGKVNVKPFDLKYEDITITVSGAHGFDKKIDYKATFDVPAKYLGSEINQLIGKINTKEAKNISIPVTANITGDFLKPQVKTDLTSGTANLTKQLIEIEKQKLLAKGKDKAKNALTNLLTGSNSNKEETDSKSASNNTEKTDTKKVVKDVIGGLLGGKKK